MYSCLSYDNLLYSITLWCNWKTVSVKGPRTLRTALFWVSLCPMISNSPVQAVEIILKWKNYTIQFNSLVIETYYSKVFCRDAENYGIIWCTLFVHICGIKLANFSAVIYRNKFKIMGTMKCLIIYFSRPQSQESHPVVWPIYNNNRCPIGLRQKWNDAKDHASIIFAAINKSAQVDLDIISFEF